MRRQNKTTKQEKTMEIYFTDLNEEAQVKYLEEFNLLMDCLESPSLENLDSFPIAIVECEEDYEQD